MSSLNSSFIFFLLSSIMVWILLLVLFIFILSNIVETLDFKLFKLSTWYKYPFNSNPLLITLNSSSLNINRGKISGIIIPIWYPYKDGFKLYSSSIVNEVPAPAISLNPLIFKFLSRTIIKSFDSWIFCK